MNRTAGAVTLWVAVLGALALCPPVVEGQQLVLRREIPTSAVTCPPIDTGTGVVTDEDRQEAARLSSAATQASIVGDHTGARDLLLRASRLNPSDPEIVYLLGRAYEELGEDGAAIRQYCRYMALEGSEADVSEVQARVTALGAPEIPEISDEAARRFRMGVVNFDLERLDTAEESFAAVVDDAPEFSAGHYNLGLARVASGQLELAAESLERYLELEPDAADRELIASAVASLRQPQNTYNAGAALATSLVLPGVGQFISGRPGAGFAFLSAAAGAAAFGWFRENVVIECRTPPVNNECAPADVVREDRERPYLATGIGVAGAIALFAAIDAYRGASANNRAAVPAVTVAMRDRVSARIGPTGIGVDRRGAVSFRLLRVEF